MTYLTDRIDANTTICGGTAAGHNLSGTSAVHSQITATIHSSDHQVTPLSRQVLFVCKTENNSVTRKNSILQTVGKNDEALTEHGNVFSIETPGDGGFGTNPNQELLPCLFIFFLQNISFYLDSCRTVCYGFPSLL